MEASKDDIMIRRGDIRLMATAEVINLLGLSSARTYQLINEGPDFPEPLVTLKVGKIWLADDVEAWERARQARMRERQAR